MKAVNANVTNLLKTIFNNEMHLLICQEVKMFLFVTRANLVDILQTCSDMRLND